MSDAPRLIASTSTLLTNLTTGASSLPVASWPRGFAFVVDRAEIEISRPRHRPCLDTVARVERLLDRALDLLLVDQDRLDDVVGLELDLVERVQVGRIGDADEQPVAALEQRQRLVLADQILAAPGAAASARDRAPGRRTAECRTRPTTRALPDALPTSPFSTSHAPIGIFWRDASSTALRASPSLNAPSATNRRAMPVMPASGAGFIWIAIGILRNSP